MAIVHISSYIQIRLHSHSMLQCSYAVLRIEQGTNATLRPEAKSLRMFFTSRRSSVDEAFQKKTRPMACANQMVTCIFSCFFPHKFLVLAVIQ